ncbi:hypothetical protein CRG98_022312 [Punica granatum]|uniref:Uncharacterized protein n=1 Tax=Punica granatum TaxID=22663 RepID=A0A2I0JMZ3_PUNGR|nr:hypothetical protein CRG98_022312 [Punica granatum]
MKLKVLTHLRVVTIIPMPRGVNRVVRRRGEATKSLGALGEGERHTRGRGGHRRWLCSVEWLLGHALLVTIRERVLGGPSKDVGTTCLSRGGKKLIERWKTRGATPLPRARADRYLEGPKARESLLLDSCGLSKVNSFYRPSACPHSVSVVLICFVVRDGTIDSTASAANGKLEMTRGPAGQGRAALPAARDPAGQIFFLKKKRFGQAGQAGQGRAALPAARDPAGQIFFLKKKRFGQAGQAGQGRAALPAARDPAGQIFFLKKKDSGKPGRPGRAGQRSPTVRDPRWPRKPQITIFAISAKSAEISTEKVPIDHGETSTAPKAISCVHSGCCRGVQGREPSPPASSPPLPPIPAALRLTGLGPFPFLRRSSPFRPNTLQSDPALFRAVFSFWWAVRSDPIVRHFFPIYREASQLSELGKFST